MSRIPLYIITLIPIILSGFKPFTNDVDIAGHLRNRKNFFYAKTNGAVVFVKGDNKILAKVKTDRKGNFEMIFVPDKERSFSFYAILSANDTVFLKSITGFDRDDPEMTFYLPSKSKN